MNALQKISSELRHARDVARRDDIDGRLEQIKFGTSDYGYDAFGLSKSHFRQAATAARLLYRYYFRAEVFGAHNIPPHGRVMFISNHSGQLPFDGLAIGCAAFLDAAKPRLVRSMLERYVPTMPFFSYWFARLGQVTGTPENCRALLQREEAILVFPEGVRGISKPYRERYQLQPFGLGFLRLALQTQTPIIPVGVVGAEEQAPAINLRRVAKLLGMPALPVVPYPPFIPIVPLPVRYRIHFGEPLRFDGDPDDDDAVIVSKVATVTAAIEALLADGLAAREHIFW